VDAGEALAGFMPGTDALHRRDLRPLLIAVDPAQHNAGIGSLLLAEMEQKLAASPSWSSSRRPVAR
jgi:hypothetical protein